MKVIVAGMMKILLVFTIALMKPQCVQFEKKFNENKKIP